LNSVPLRTDTGVASSVGCLSITVSYIGCLSIPVGYEEHTREHIMVRYAITRNTRRSMVRQSLSVPLDGMRQVVLGSVC
jgi:hypothetical protein